MKHVATITVSKPVKAEEVAWIQLKDLIAPAKISPTQSTWLSMQWDNLLQK
jgi:hypothetical protein